MMQPVIRKNHMDIAWHEYTDENGADIPVTQASLTEKASIIGRVGIMFLSCGTGAWRVRSSMNTLAESLHFVGIKNKNQSDLPILCRLLYRQGGYIKVVSELRQGSEFSIIPRIHTLFCNQISNPVCQNSGLS